MFSYVLNLTTRVGPFPKGVEFGIFIVQSRECLKDAFKATLKAQSYFLGFIVFFFKDSQLANLIIHKEQ